MVPVLEPLVHGIHMGMGHLYLQFVKLIRLPFKNKGKTPKITMPPICGTKLPVVIQK